MSAPGQSPAGHGTLLTFDCYGTLIDWETGILSALRAAFPPAGRVADEELLEQFHTAQNELKSSEYRSYRDLLTEVATRMARTHGWDSSADRASMLPASIPSWQPFPDTNAALRRLVDAEMTLGILSNIDNDLLAATLEHLEVRFALLGTAQSLLSYKPAAPHFERGREWAGEYERWFHVAQSLFHDVTPATGLGIPVVWVNRKNEALPEEAAPIHVAPDLARAVSWLLELPDPGSPTSDPGSPTSDQE